MTRADFIARAVKKAEADIQVPAGWWGTWRDITDGVYRVRFSAHSSAWVLSSNGWFISLHDSRSFAISKARRIAP